MGLEQVIGDVRKDGDQRAQRILDDARAEAERILAAAKETVGEYEQQRQSAASRDAGQLQAQIASSAEFDSRKAVLTTEASLRDELRGAILDHFGDLDDGKRKQHIDALLKQAKATIPDGSVFGSKKDAATLEAQSDYEFGGTIDVIGGIVVESKDGAHRLDLSYETLIGDMWRDILRSESELFV